MSTSTSTSASTVPDRERVDPPSCDLNADDMFESLTGFDEIAIRGRFDRNVHDLSQADPLQFMRALVFVAERRRDLKDPEAWKAAQGLSLGQVHDYFADDDDDPMPEDDPSTDQGKGEPASERPPSS